MGLKGKTEGLSPKIFCRSEAPLNVSSSLLCHPEPSFFVTPSEARGPSALTHLGKTGWRLSPRASFFVTPSEARGPLRTPSRAKRGMHGLRSAGQGRAVPPSHFFCFPELFFCRPEPFFYCRPERSEGSLGTYAPREDTDGLSPRGVSRGGSSPVPL